MFNVSTEYLIKHEDSINWEALSDMTDDEFSLTEIRLFRKRINWKKYLKNHKGQMSGDMFEIASKYFTPEVYRMIAVFNLAPNSFIESHAEFFDFKLLIENSDLSQETLLKCQKYWSNIPNIQESFKKSKFIHLDDPAFIDLKCAIEIL